MPEESVKPVEFVNRGAVLRGALHLPADVGPPREKGPAAPAGRDGAPQPPPGHRRSGALRKRVPAVLMCHGLTGHRIEAHRLFVKAARAFAAAGLAALRFDFRGSGESDGDFEAMTVSGEVSDCLAALDWLARRRAVDRHRLGILGLSLGGMVTALVLARTERFRSAALWSAAARIPWTEVLTPAQVRRWRRRGYLNLDGMNLGWSFLEDLARHDPLAAIARSSLPVLVVHGTEDQVLPVTQAREFERALRRRPPGAGEVEVFIVPGADHTYSRRDWEGAVIARTVDWFRRTLAGAPSAR